MTLWETFKRDKYEDLHHTTALAADSDMTLSATAGILQIHSKTLAHFQNANPAYNNVVTPTVTRVHLNYDPVVLPACVIVSEALLTPVQRVVYEVVNSSPSHPPINSFLDGIGGSGKTFTYSLLLDRSRALT